mgnify:CR=1 FL=1
MVGFNERYSCWSPEDEIQIQLRKYTIHPHPPQQSHHPLLCFTFSNVRERGVVISFRLKVLIDFETTDMLEKKTAVAL